MTTTYIHMCFISRIECPLDHILPINLHPLYLHIPSSHSRACARDSTARPPTKCGPPTALGVGGVGGAAQRSIERGTLSKTDAESRDVRGNWKGRERAASGNERHRQKGWRNTTQVDESQN